jgi:hypothetical protein
LYRKLTTYTLRRTIRDFASSIRAAENKIESLEKVLQEIRQKAGSDISSAEDSSFETTETNDASAKKYIDDRLYRQVLFTNLFSSVQGRDPLRSTFS